MTTMQSIVGLLVTFQFCDCPSHDTSTPNTKARMYPTTIHSFVFSLPVHSGVSSWFVLNLFWRLEQPEFLCREV